MPPKTPYDLKWEPLTADSGRLSWKQDHETEDEKPTKFSLEAVGFQHLDKAIPDPVCEGTTSKHHTTLKHLKARTEYTMKVRAENKDGSKECPITFTIQGMLITSTIIYILYAHDVLNAHPPF